MASPLSSPVSPVFLRQALCSLSSPVQRAPPLVGHLQQQLITPHPLQVTFAGAARLPAAGAERKPLGNYEHRRGRPPWSPEVTPKLGLPPSRAGRQAVSQVGSGRACRALLDPDAAALRPKHSPFRPDRDRAGHREGLAAGAHSEPRGSSVWSQRGVAGTCYPRASTRQSSHRWCAWHWGVAWLHSTPQSLGHPSSASSAAPQRSGQRREQCSMSSLSHQQGQFPGSLGLSPCRQAALPSC